MKKKELVIVGFITFALFVGAGNIIFPPFIGLKAGENVWFAASGFLITGVGLPVLSLIAMARNNGSLREFTLPAGKTLGLLLTVICYLALGPLFALPRTATVSYEMGLSSLSNGKFPLSAFSATFFCLVAICSMNPGKLINILGKYLSPIKVLSLALLGLFAFFKPGGSKVFTQNEYLDHPFSGGIVNGYLTMDTLAALVFSMIVIKAIKMRGVTLNSEITKFTTISALIAATGLTYVYISLFYLGVFSYEIIPIAANGATVLQAYVVSNFGYLGSIFLMTIITLACFVTAVGLTGACAEFFSERTGISYGVSIIILSIISASLSNLGLTQIIKFSLPALTSVYPPFIILVISSVIFRPENRPKIIILPGLITALTFGILQSFIPEGFIPEIILAMPLYHEGLGWIIPALTIIIVVSLLRKIVIKKET